MTNDKWSIENFESLDIQTIDGDRGKNYPKKEDYLENGFSLFLGADNIVNGKLNFAKKTFISEQKHLAMGKGIVKDNDILLVMRGNGTGRSCIFQNTINCQASRINSGLVILRTNDKFTNVNFIHQLFSSPVIQKQFESFMFGSAQPQLTIQLLKSLKFLTPPIKEQQKIAEILSTSDKAIETVEKLIANSQEQKKALMQQLLTGKKRLLDKNGVRFSDDWQKCSLTDLCSIKTGKKDVNEGNPNGIYPFFTCANLPTKSDNYSFDCEALLIAGNGILGKTHYYKGKFEAYQRTYVLSEFNQKVNVPYLHQFILYWLMRDIEREKQHGAMPYIKLGLLQNFLVLLPSFEEQQKIAQVLTIADREIDLYQQQLDKLKLEKKALMQQLLTGQKRVKVAA